MVLLRKSIPQNHSLQTATELGIITSGYRMGIEPFLIIGVAISMVVFIYVYAYFLRPNFLKKKFLRCAEISKEKNILNVFAFPLSPFMLADEGSIIEGKTNGVAFYQSLQSQALSNVWYIVLNKKTRILNGVYGSGYVKNTIDNVRTFDDLKKLFESQSVSKIKAELSLKDSQECIEVFNGNAYVYYKCGSIIGSNSINIAFQNI